MDFFNKDSRKKKAISHTKKWIVFLAKRYNILKKIQ